MTKPFQIKGVKPQWQIVYDRIADMEIGDTISHAELAALLSGAAPTSRNNAFHQAVRHLEEDRLRTLGNVRGVGYKMAEASEHEQLGRQHHKKAKRSLGRAKRKFASADRSLLTSDERRRIDALEDHVSRQQVMIRRLDARMERAETGLREVRRTQREGDASLGADLGARIDRLTRLLERHGITESAAKPELKAA